MENNDTLLEQQPIEPPKPNNNMVLSIVSTVLGCCSFWLIGLVLGIIAIVFSSQVDTKYNNGDYEGAEKAAKNARLLALIALGLFVLNIIYTGVMFAMNGEEMMEMYREALEQYQ